MKRGNNQKAAQALAVLFDNAVCLADSYTGMKKEDKFATAKSYIKLNLNVKNAKKIYGPVINSLTDDQIKDAIEIVHEATRRGVKETLTERFLGYTKKI